MLRLSQGHLNLLETCPPKFQQSFLNQASSLPNPEIEEKQTWGKRFHLLMQQRELGLPIESLLAAETELNHSLKALIQAAPELLVSDRAVPRLCRDRNQKREAEHSLTLNFGNYLLTAIYDLLIAEENRAKIIDWKTYLQPQNKHKLARNWQTRLYLYVLAETSDYTPEQLSMTYWFVKLPTKPKHHTFLYNNQLHQQTKQDLTELLTNLDSWLSCDLDKAETLRECNFYFPHHHSCESNCPYYQELLISQDHKNDKGNQVSNLDLLQNYIQNIAEIPL